MICSLSGEKVIEPILSPKSGAVFEKKHIVNYLKSSNIDPINNEPLTIEDLIPIKVGVSEIVPPKPPKFNSIPQLLIEFQNEWDSLVLEVFTLRKELYEVKKKLSSSMYHYDAAVNVAANVLKERDELKEALRELTCSLNVKNNSEDKTVEKNYVDILNKARDELYNHHKQNKIPFPFLKDQNFELKYIKNHVLSNKTIDEIYLDSKLKKLIFSTSENDLYSYDFFSSIIQKIQIDNLDLKISSLCFFEKNNELISIISSKEKLVVGNNSKIIKTLHTDVITEIILHPSLNDFFFVVGKDNIWSFYFKDQMLHTSPSSKITIMSADLHVDGILFGISLQNGTIIIYNSTDFQELCTLFCKYQDVMKIKFAQNGYWLLAGQNDIVNKKSCIQIFDLRKNIVVFTLDFDHMLNDFILDPSSCLLITCTSSKIIELHKYDMKQKKWTIQLLSDDLENMFAKNYLFQDESLTSINLLSTSDDDCYKKNKEMRFIGITSKKNVLEYLLS